MEVLSQGMQELDLRERKDVEIVISEKSATNSLCHLTSLNLEYTDVKDASLCTVGKEATSLTKLNLNACQEISDEGLKAVAQNVSNLVELSVYWNVKITDEGVKEICMQNSRIANLRLSGCKRLTDASVVSITSSCKNLTSLDLTRCSKISDASLNIIAKSATTLQILLLYAASGFGDEGVAAITGSLHNLQILDICGTGELTDVVSLCLGVHSAGRQRSSPDACLPSQGMEPASSGSLSALRKLNIGWCPKLTDLTLDSLGRGCSSLEYLYLLGNPNMTLQGLGSLSRGCTRLCAGVSSRRSWAPGPALRGW